jgi:hypothetical protein
MVRRNRAPDGWVAALESDGVSVCYPPHPAWDRLTEIFLGAQQVDGADTFIGRSACADTPMSTRPAWRNSWGRRRREFPAA